MFDENCFFSRGAPAARQSGACVPDRRWAGGTPACTTPAPGGHRGSSQAPERHVRQQPTVGNGAPVARKSRPYIPCPRLAGGSGRASERRSCPRLAGGAPAARQSSARSPGPRTPFWNLRTLKCKKNIYLE